MGDGAAIEKVKTWLRDGAETAALLKKTPPELDKRAEFELLSFL